MIVGEFPPLPPALIHQLHREYRSRLYDWAWQSMANGVVVVFEGWKRYAGN